MQIEIEPGDLKDRRADDRGRINLGTEFEGKQVLVAVLEVEDKDQ